VGCDRTWCERGRGWCYKGRPGSRPTAPPWHSPHDRDGLRRAACLAGVRREDLPPPCPPLPQPDRFRPSTFCIESTTTMTQNRRIIIFDTTLRDGEQSPGASMNMQEKLEVAQALVELGVDVIEAGFPIASQGDFESVQQI